MAYPEGSAAGLSAPDSPLHRALGGSIYPLVSAIAVNEDDEPGVAATETNRNGMGQHGTLKLNQFSYLPVIPYISVSFPRLKSRVRVPFPALKTP